MRIAIALWAVLLCMRQVDGQTVGPFEPDADTIALYHLDEASGDKAVDSSGKGNHGTIGGAGRVEGIFGKALKFDGKDDQVTIPDHPSLKDLKQLTVEAWTRMQGEGGRQFICGKDAEWHFDVADETGGIGLSLYSHSGKEHRRTGTGGFYFPPFQWTHVAATYDGKQVKFFQNGVLVDVVPGPEDFLLTSDRPFYIGTYQNKQYFFAGCIDELRISRCVRYDAKNAAQKKQQVFQPVIPAAAFCTVSVRESKRTGLWRIEAAISTRSESPTSGFVFVKQNDHPSVAVGKWEIKGEKDVRVEKTSAFDVSDEVIGPGRYTVIFRAAGGGQAVRVDKVALASNAERIESRSPSRIICTRYDMDAAFDVSFGKRPPMAAGDIFRFAKDFDFCSGRMTLMKEDDDKCCPLLTGQGAAVYYINFPRDGAYEIYLKYAAKRRAPLDATLDDVDVNPFDPFTNTATGGMFLKDALWEYEGTCSTTAGVHSLALSGYFPSTAAILIRPTKGTKPIALGPERGGRPAGPALSGKWICTTMIGRTDQSSADVDADSRLAIRYRFENTDPANALADDALRVEKEVFWDLSAVGAVRFRLEGDPLNHLLRLRVEDAKGDSRLIGQARVSGNGEQEIQWPVTFEGDAICDGAAIGKLVIEVHEANGAPTSVSQGRLAMKDFVFLFRDEPGSILPEKKIAMPERLRPDALTARQRSVCVMPVVPEDYPTFAAANPKPVTRKTLGYGMHATGSRSFSADSLDRFHNVYWFGDVTWPHVGSLFGKDMEARVADIMGRGLFMFDLWGYVPADRGELGGKAEYKIDDTTHQWLLATCGDRFLGYDNGEQDGRYIGAYASRSEAKTRKEAFEDFDRWDAKIRKNQQNFLVSTGSLNFCHYYGHFGCILLGLETAQGLPSDSLLFAFLRGACKQYGRLWHQGISVWSRYGYKLYDRREVMPHGSSLPGYGCGPTKGASASLMKRLWYVGYLGGCSIAGTETGQFTARMLPDGRPELSPIGEMNVEGVTWVEKHPGRGEQYTPVAAMLDFYHGWNMPRHLYRSDRYKIWGKFDYEKGDHMIDNFFRMVLPGYEDCSYFRNGRGFLCETPYGEIVDVLVSTAPDHVLKRYDAIVLLGGVTLDGDLLKRIKQWVSDGGDLFVCTAQAPGVPEMFLGVKNTGQQGKATAALSLADGVIVSDQTYSYDIVELAGAQPVAVSEKGHPIVTVNPFGQGRVVCIAADFAMTDAVKYKHPDLVNMEPRHRLLKVVEHILGNYFRSLALVEVQPARHIQLVTNVTMDRQRLVVGLFNNDEFHNWVGKLRVVKGTIAEVRDWVDEKKLKPAPWIDVDVPAGEFRILEIRTKEDCIPPIRKIEMK